MSFISYLFTILFFVGTFTFAPCLQNSKCNYILWNQINNFDPVFCMLCLILSILLPLKKFPYCQFIFHIKRILSHVMADMPPGKTDCFSWYTMHATRPERVKGLIFTRLFILWINCETLHINSLTWVGSNERWCPKFFNDFDIIMTSLKAKGHQNFNIAKTHK